MEAGLREFVKAYAKDKSITEIEAAMYAGALNHKILEDTLHYKEFVITLNQVAPQLLQLINVLERSK